MFRGFRARDLAKRRFMPTMVFVDTQGNRREVDAPVGLSVLEVAHKHGIDLEGACEGSLACSTCHVIVDPSDFGRLPSASDNEEDLLDLAAHVTRTSRLSCQIWLEGIDSLTVRLPGATHNMQGR